jgi:hypothetical protein
MHADREPEKPKRSVLCKRREARLAQACSALPSARQRAVRAAAQASRGQDAVAIEADPGRS